MAVTALVARTRSGPCQHTARWWQGTSRPRRCASTSCRSIQKCMLQHYRSKEAGPTMAWVATATSSVQLLMVSYHAMLSRFVSCSAVHGATNRFHFEKVRKQGVQACAADTVQQRGDCFRNFYRRPLLTPTAPGCQSHCLARLGQGTGSVSRSG